MTTGLVDVHSHFVTDSYIAAARSAGHDRPDGMPAWPTWSADDHLNLMEHNGIDIAMQSVSSPGVHFGDDAAARRLAREVNEFGAGTVAAHPNRLGHFASLPVPDIDGALTELAYALDKLGSDGVTLESNAHGMYLGDTRLHPLLEELNRRSSIVFVHPTAPPNASAVALGRPIPMIEFLFDTARTVTDLILADSLLRYPDINWLFTHGGGVLPLLADRIGLFRTLFVRDEQSQNQPALSEQLAELWYDMAGTPFPTQIPALTRLVGTDHILYGSDYCFTPPPGVAGQVTLIDKAPAPKDSPDWRTLTTANAHRLFPRLAALH